MVAPLNKSEISAFNPEQQLRSEETLTDAERYKLLVEWNNTTREYPQDKCIHQLFEEQVERTPDAIAVVFESQQLTYLELNAKANQLVHYLQELGVGPEVLVGICVERSIDMIVGLLGILKAGGAYVPLDAAYPSERLAFMLQDSSVSVLLTQSKLIEKLPPHSAYVVYLDKDWEEIVQQSKENPSSSVTPDNLAYVIYTSGSTGRPKGVCCCHTGVVNLYTDFQSKQPLSVGDRCSLWTGISFDVSVYEIFSALLAGGTLYIVSNNVRSDTQTFLDWLNFHQIHSAYIPPFMLNQLSERVLQGTHKVSLRRLLVGVEPIPTRLLTSLSKEIPGLYIINGYGPTEATICATLYSVSSFEVRSGNTPIGKPVLNTKIYLLNEQMQPVPIGVPGELHIGGVGLARGYLNRPNLTKEKFISNSFSNEPGDRLYKTGDLARYLPDGNIEFIGRIDNQVKIRGFRIELGEIEAVLSQHPAVLETVVVARQDVSDRKYLAAYIVPRDARAISRSNLCSFLKEKLPVHMIPGVFVMLDALPLTPNGKVDRHALHEYGETMELNPSQTNISNLKMDINSPAKHRDTGLKTTPSDSIRSTLRSLVAKLLQIESDEIDATATFLELGTDSLLLLEIMQSIKSNFGVKVEVQQFFEELETIETLANYIEKNGLEDSESSTFPNFELKFLDTIEELTSSKSPQELAQAQTLDVAVAVPQYKTMKKANENVESETSVERIIAQQLQLMSQQLELLRNDKSHKDLKPLEKRTVTEFASPKSFDRSATVTNPSPVCSYNEWDPLEEVIVGIVDGAMVPSWHTIHRATVLPGQEKQMESLAKRTEKQPLPYPEWLVQAATKCVDGFAHILESEGVIVRRPDIVDYSASFRTPDWEVMNGFCSANPRDVFLVIGNEIIEAPMADRSRYFESWAYRSLLKEYLKGGAKWVAAPKPQLLDTQYDPDYKTPAPGEERRFVITEFEPTFDAADFVRFGRDIFVQKSHVTNSLGIEWVRRHLGDKYRVHEVKSLCPQALHIDTTLVPLAPGKVLVNPLFIDVDNLPDYFKSWDILLAPKPNRTPMTLYDTKVISQWVNMNVLSLDEERVIVEKSQESTIQALKDWGFKPIPCEFESYYPFMGSFHCATLDVRRRGELRSYEMEEGAL
ncbi:amino acid adenylation domain-containing protein [Microcoleus sp. w2-18bC1]|uniref:amino acid adenylation domain-containing protein n=1 Tax=unclassified Microcoleus TaxID=2642155 RepID=UPI002FD33049